MLECRQDTSLSRDGDNIHEGPSRRLCLKPLSCDDLINPVHFATNLPPPNVRSCVDALPLYMIVHPRKSTTSMVCRLKPDRCLTLWQSRKHSSSIFEHKGAFVALFKAMIYVLEPSNDKLATKVR